MAADREETIAHLFRRAGFGVSDAELTSFARAGIGGFTAAISYLVNYTAQPDDVDQHIGAPGYVGTTSRGGFNPRTVIDDARQRWLFRMVHSQRPLQEKMTLFWHNHFATAYSKIAGAAGTDEAGRLLAAKPAEDRRASRDSSSCCASTRSATSAIFWSRSRRIRRCCSGSTVART